MKTSELRHIIIEAIGDIKRSEAEYRKREKLIDAIESKIGYKVFRGDSPEDSMPWHLISTKIITELYNNICKK